jgi:hypothetical protein
MFFLLRVAFWLSIVLVLLPSGDYQPKDKAAAIGAGDAVSAAAAAVSDLGDFCKRQPEACAVGGQAASAFGQRAQAGARFLFDLLHDRMSDKSPSAQSGPAQTGSVRPTSQHTLTPEDLRPEWRNPLPPRDPRRRPA